MDQRRRRSGVVAAALYTVVGAIASLGLDSASAASAGSALRLGDGVLLMGWLALPVVGAVVLWYIARHTVGRLLLGMGVAGTTYLLCHSWAIWALRTHPGQPGGTAAAAVAAWASIPAIGAIVFIPAVLPDGLTSRRMRRFAGGAMAALGVLSACQALAPDRLDGVPWGITPIDNPAGVESLAGVVRIGTGSAAVVLVAFVLTAVADLIRRARSAQGETRQQLRWVTAACAILPITMIAAFVVDALGSRRWSDILLISGQVSFLVGLAGALGVAVLRYRLWDLDLVLRRSYVLAGVTISLAAVYVATVAFVGYAIAPDGGLSSILATVAVAVAVQPMRSAVSRWVEQLVLRGRRQPYVVLTALGQRLSNAKGPEDALQDVLDTVASELRRPWVRLELFGDETVDHSLDDGPGGAERFPVVHRGEVLGDLVVARRRPGERLEPGDRQLLGDLVRQAAALVDAVRMERELEQSHERVLRQRDRERERLRRDLHDGLGPTLASLMLRVDVTSDSVPTDTAAGQHLVGVREGLHNAVEEVRRIVDDLRPTDLDERGLVEALRARFDGLKSDSNSAPMITIRTWALGRLPEPVELGLFRIASEAVTNVLRHAGAKQCSVLFAGDADSVALDVVDDGAGMSDAKTDGVGMRSMEDRAAALGGTFAVSPGMGRGTRISVVVPRRA